MAKAKIVKRLEKALKIVDKLCRDFEALSKALKEMKEIGREDETEKGK